MAIQLQNVASDAKEAKATVSILTLKLGETENKLRDTVLQKDKASEENQSLSSALKEAKAAGVKLDSDKKALEGKIRTLERDEQDLQRRFAEETESLKREVEATKRQVQRADDRARDQIAFIEKESRCQRPVPSSP